jgi:hypothetical protein
MDEMKTGQKAIRLGLISPERMNACLDIRGRLEASGVTPPPVAEIALQKGWITREDVSAIYGEAPAARSAPPRRVFRERAVEARRRQERRGLALLLLLTAAAIVGSIALEMLLRT